MEIVLRTPIDERDIEKLKVRDVVYIDGIIITARDMTHRLIIEKLRKGELNPKMFDGGVIYHAGPVVKKEGKEWKIISIGPTTSLRMEKYIPELLELANIRLIVGKGGVGPRSEEAIRKHRSVYGIFPGGCGIVAAQKVKKVIDVFYLDELGIPEAMWILEVEKFGPVIITVAPR